MLRTISTIPILALMTACVTGFSERHYFQTLDPNNIPTNYYRIAVKGWSAFSAARYVSGYYDERAVDLFFDELQLAETDAGNPNTRKLFTMGIDEPQTQSKIMPLSPNGENGAFVMVISSNASAVTNAIGQFAENQIVAEAMTNLANRDLLQQTAGLPGTPLFERRQAAVASQEIAGLFKLVSQSDQPDPGKTRRSLVRVVNAIARARGADIQFNTLQEAEEWVNAQN